MPLFRILLLAFLFVPIVEIYVLIEVGSRVGALTTVALVVLTAVVGATLMRAQGFATAERVRTELASGELPALTMMEGVLILVAGALLLTPGFVTDAVGFGLLIPPWRRALVTLVARRLGESAGLHGHRRVYTAGTVVDGEYTDESDPENRGRSTRGRRLESPDREDF